PDVPTMRGSKRTGARSIGSFDAVRCRGLSLGYGMRRREFVTLLAGAATGWPFGVHAQQSTMPAIASEEGRSLNRRPSMPDNGVVSVQSRFAMRETVDRLLAAVTERRLTIFARIDHAASATSIGLPLRPTELVIFGNPKGGTALMQDRQSAGIDLPLKALI